nr:Hypothetical protein FSTVLC9_186 [Faustovirus]
MEPHFIEIVEVKPGHCGGVDDADTDIINTDYNGTFIGGGEVPIIDSQFDAFLGGDDNETNPNTYIIGGCEYVFDNVKFAFLQHLYDIEAGKPSTIDPDKILADMYSEAADLVSVKQAARDVVCGFECFINGVLLRLERAGKIKDIVALIPPKPEFCSGVELDVEALRIYLDGFNVDIKLSTGDDIVIKFDLPEYKEIPQDAAIEVDESHPYAHIYAEFKETETKGRKMLSELIYLDSALHIIIENINKLQEIIAQLI